MLRWTLEFIAHCLQLRDKKNDFVNGISGKFPFIRLENATDKSSCRMERLVKFIKVTEYYKIFRFSRKITSAIQVPI